MSVAIAKEARTMVVLDYIAPGDGDFNDPANFSPPDIPTASDFVRFSVGMGIPYTVTFPGNLPIESLAAYTTSQLRVRVDTVTFSGSRRVDRGPATYAVVSGTTTEADRGIIIGELSGDTAVLNVSPASPSGLGLVAFRGVAATIGDAANSTGTLNVSTGAFIVTGSDFNAITLIVGNQGTGTLSITNGAELNVPGFNSRVTLGNHATGVGTATVSGVGSIWINNNELWVGGSGAGTLIIQDGGRLRCSSSAGSSNIIGALPGASGTATVTGPGSTWTYSNELVVGNGGDGALAIVDGGTVINNVAGSTEIGRGGNGTATVTGPGSTWNTNGSLNVGSTATGTCEVLNGGSLTSGSAVIRGLNAGSGHVLVADPGSTWTVSNGPLTIGLPESGFSTGPTSLTIAPGGTVVVKQKIILNTNGLLQLHGGTLSADEIGPNVFQGQFDWTAGTFMVHLFFKSLTNQGGKLAPQLVNGGADIDGTYTQLPGAELEIQVGGSTWATQYAFVGIEGPAVLDGLLRLTLINGFVPTAAQTFTVLGSSSIQGSFSNVANGQRLMTTDGLGSFVVNYEPEDEEGRHHVVLTEFLLGVL